MGVWTYSSAQSRRARTSDSLKSPLTGRSLKYMKELEEKASALMRGWLTFSG